MKSKQEEDIIDHNKMLLIMIILIILTTTLLGVNFYQLLSRTVLMGNNISYSIHFMTTNGGDSEKANISIFLDDVVVFDKCTLRGNYHNTYWENLSLDAGDYTTTYFENDTGAFKIFDMKENTFHEKLKLTIKSETWVYISFFTYSDRKPASFFTVQIFYVEPATM